MSLKTVSIPGEECCRYISKMYSSPYSRKRAMVHLKKNRRQIIVRIQDVQIAHDVVCSGNDNMLSPEITVSLVVAYLEAEDDLLERLKYISVFMMLFKML